jgi:transcriptional regulator with XRE-family HTH domain
MSILRAASPSSSRLSAIRRRTWGELFGQFIQSSREKKCRSVEEAARLAGMETSRWEAIEAGQVPTTLEQLHSIAAALDMDGAEMRTLVVFCREAWGR